VTKLAWVIKISCYKKTNFCGRI